jgi:prophage regulatory protein
MPKTILRLPSVKSESGLSRSTLYLRITQGLWTKPISLGGRSVGWPASEVIALNAARIAGKSDTEVRELVRSLESDRKKVPIGKGVNLFIRLVLLTSVLVKSLVVLAF